MCIGSDRLVVVVVLAGVVFGVPRPSKAASEGPRRLPRGYLGLFGDVLSLLGAILGYVGVILGPPWEVLGGTWAHRGVSIDVIDEDIKSLEDLFEQTDAGFVRFRRCKDEPARRQAFFLKIRHSLCFLRFEV